MGIDRTSRWAVLPMTVEAESFRIDPGRAERLTKEFDMDLMAQPPVQTQGALAQARRDDAIGDLCSAERCLDRPKAKCGLVGARQPLGGRDQPGAARYVIQPSPPTQPDPSEYPAIQAKVAAITTRRQAAMYTWDVAARMEARRLSLAPSPHG
jgi:hypothetical protein